MSKVVKALFKATAFLISLAVLLVGYFFMVRYAIEINGYLGNLAMLSPFLASSFIVFYLEEIKDEKK